MITLAKTAAEKILIVLMNCFYIKLKGKPERVGSILASPVSRHEIGKKSFFRLSTEKASQMWGRELIVILTELELAGSVGEPKYINVPYFHQKVFSIPLCRALEKSEVLPFLEQKLEAGRGNDIIFSHFNFSTFFFYV